MDAWAAADAVELCLRARSEGNFRMQMAVVPNAVEARTRISAALPNDLRSLGLPVLENGIRRRVAHPDAMADGTTASLDDPGSAAAKEIGELLDAIELLQARFGVAHRLHH
jgi:chromosome partitioning protein